MGQQAFNSCMILLLDAMETGDLGRIWKVEKAFAVFTELDKHGVHKLANLAVERVSWGLNELKRMGDQTMANVRGQPKAPRRWGDIEMQGAAGSEAMQGSGTSHDTVMGNTGMLLLEDPGLQAFVPEAFSPLSWGVASGGDLTDSKPLHLHMHMQLDQQEEGQKQGERACDEEEEMDRLSESDDTTRSSEGLQGIQVSAQGSAPLRYATFWTAPSQEHGEAQGPTWTSPISPPDSTILMQQQHHHLEGMSTGLYQIPPPPHLRHHSYPSLHQHVAAPPFHHPSALDTRRQRINSFANPNPPPHPHTRSSPTTLYVSSLTSLTESQSPLQPFPEPAAQPQLGAIPLHHTSNPSVHPSWAARPVAPIARVSEPALSFSDVFDQARGTPISLAQNQHAVQDASPDCDYKFPFQMNTPGDEDELSMAAVLGTTGLEQIDLQTWKWVGSGG